MTLKDIKPMESFEYSGRFYVKEKLLHFHDPACTQWICTDIDNNERVFDENAEIKYSDRLPLKIMDDGGIKA